MTTAHTMGRLFALLYCIHPMDKHPACLIDTSPGIILPVLIGRRRASHPESEFWEPIGQLASLISLNDMCYDLDPDQQADFLNGFADEMRDQGVSPIFSDELSQQYFS